MVTFEQNTSVPLILILSRKSIFSGEYQNYRILFPNFGYFPVNPDFQIYRQFLKSGCVYLLYLLFSSFPGFAANIFYFFPSGRHKLVEKRVPTPNTSSSNTGNLSFVAPQLPKMDPKNVSQRLCKIR